jgi:uncharacterized protein YjdB
MRLAVMMVLAWGLAGCSADDDGGMAQGDTVTLTLSSMAPMTAPGETRTVTYVVKDAKMAVVSSPLLSWATSAPEVAVVTPSATDATITAVGDGTATITASTLSGQGSVVVTVHRELR